MHRYCPRVMTDAAQRIVSYENNYHKWAQTWRFPNQWVGIVTKGAAVKLDFNSINFCDVYPFYRSQSVAYSTTNRYLKLWWLMGIGCFNSNVSWNVMEIEGFSFSKMHLKISPAKCWPFWYSLDFHQLFRQTAWSPAANKINHDWRHQIISPSAAYLRQWIRSALVR